jgi:hypothetical protein
LTASLRSQIQSLQKQARLNTRSPRCQRVDILDQTRLAVENRARDLLAQLQESESVPVAEADDEVSA